MRPFHCVWLSKHVSVFVCVCVCVHSIWGICRNVQGKCLEMCTGDSTLCLCSKNSLLLGLTLNCVKVSLMQCRLMRCQCFTLAYNLSLFEQKLFNVTYFTWMEACTCKDTNYYKSSWWEFLKNEITLCNQHWKPCPESFLPFQEVLPYHLLPLWSTSRKPYFPCFFLSFLAHTYCD